MAEINEQLPTFSVWQQIQKSCGPLMAVLTNLMHCLPLYCCDFQWYRRHHASGFTHQNIAFLCDNITSSPEKNNMWTSGVLPKPANFCLLHVNSENTPVNNKSEKDSIEQKQTIDSWNYHQNSQGREKFNQEHLIM